jgi:hypothetical protein
MKELVLGLDWDGTVSDYPLGFAFLAGLFSKCVIITINDEITPDLASSTLNIEIDKVTVEICTHEHLENYQEWKANRCVAHQVDLMFDDDPGVVLACINRGIRAITVSEFIYRYSDKLKYWGKNAKFQFSRHIIRIYLGKAPMLGHLNPPLCRLPLTARNHYRLIYCSLCAALRRRFGLTASLLVNHELALTVMALLPETAPTWLGESSRTRCPARLLAVHQPVWQHRLFERAADYSLLLGWLKAVDWAADQPAWHRRLARNWLTRQFAQIAPSLAQDTRACPQIAPRLPQDTRDLAASYSALAARPDAPFAEVEALSAALAAHLAEKLGEETPLPPPHWQAALPLFTQIGGLIPRADHLLDFRRDRVSGQYNPLLTAGVPPKQAYREAWATYTRQAEALHQALSELPGLFAETAETAQAALAALSARIEREKNPVLGIPVGSREPERKDRRQWCDCCCNGCDCGGDCCTGCGRPLKSACSDGNGDCCHGCHFCDCSCCS